MKKTVFILLLLVCSSAFATTYTFTGNGSWSVSANWFGNAVPPPNLNAEDNIIIDGSGPCFLDVSITIKFGVHLTIKTGKTLNINQSISVIDNGSLDCNGILLNSGTISTDNSIYIEAGGALQNQSLEVIDLLSYGEIYFNGTGSFINDGVINLKDLLTADIYLGPVVLQNNGTLKGDGVIQGLTNNNATGIISPGNASGNIYFTSLSTSGTVSIQLGGANQNSEYDVITALNNVNINGGTLNVSLINGFLPHGSQSFVIILNGTHAGTFSQVNFPVLAGVTWSVQYLGDQTIIQTLSTLPVRYLSFSGQQIGSQIALNWRTAFEQDNVGFTIERSADGLTWSAIGTKASNTEKKYSFLDGQPLLCMNYYRLKQLDASGTSSYSNVINVRMVSDRWEIYPNPAQTSLWIKGQNIAKSKFSIYTLSGSLIREVTLTSGRIDISDLLPSIYFLRANEGGRTIIFPFIKN